MGSQPTKTQIILFLFIFFLLKSLGAHAHKALKSITPNLVCHCSVTPNLVPFCRVVGGGDVIFSKMYACLILNAPLPYKLRELS